MGVPRNDALEPDEGRREERPRSKFLDSLRGEAYIAAEDLGTEILFNKDNILKVIEAVRKNLFPLVEQESKELYRLGTQIGGILSRQAGESMTSYLSRRNRWWRKLKQRDDKVQISEGILTDLLRQCWHQQAGAPHGLNRLRRLYKDRGRGESLDQDA